MGRAFGEDALTWARRGGYRATDSNGDAGAPEGTITMRSMKASVHDRYGRADVLEVREVDRPGVDGKVVPVKIVITA